MHRNGSDKVRFANDAAYSDSKDLAKRTISDKNLKGRTCETARNCSYDGYQKVLSSMIYRCFNKKTGSGIIANEQLAKELHELVNIRFKRRNVYARFKDNIWEADLSEMESLSYKNKNVKYLLCFIDIFTRYAWVTHLKHKNIKQFLMPSLKY